MPGDWFCVVKVKNERPICCFAFALLFKVIFAVGGKLGHLPRLPFILSEILNDERLYTRDSEQSLARSVNGKPAEVAGNPAAIELLSHGRSRSAPAKTIQD
jgi:hypothetical protein